MRISRENVAKRVAHVKSLLAVNSKMTVKEINTSLSAEFGHKMAPGKIVAIRKELAGVDVGTAAVTKDLDYCQAGGTLVEVEPSTVTVRG